MKVLVTGSAGFLGRFLVPGLREKGHTVIALDRKETLGLRCDLADPRACRTAVEGVNAVVHLAGVTAFGGCYEANMLPLRNLAAAAADSGVDRLLFSSTINVHGSGEFQSSRAVHVPERLPIDQDSSTHGRDDYSRAKLDGEHLLQEVTSRTDLKAYCFRLPSIWLPSFTCAYVPWADSDLTLRRFIDPWTYLDIRDLLEAVHAYLVHPSPPKFRASYLLADDTTRPESTEWLFSTSLPHLLSLFDVPPEGHRPWFCSATAKTDLGWSPKVTWRKAPFDATPDQPPARPRLRSRLLAEWRRLRQLGRRSARRIVRRGRPSQLEGQISAAVPEFESLFADPVAKGVVGEFEFLEGPLWRPETGDLLFSDIPGNRIFRLDESGQLSTYRSPSGHSNGLTRDPEGRVLACEHGQRRVTREEHDGSLTVLADRYQGLLLNSPNDLVSDRSGRIYFTDPPYGISAQQQQLPFQGVFLLDPADGELRLLAQDMKRPNGLAFSPDGSKLYVADSALCTVRAYGVEKDGGLGAHVLFCTIPLAKPGPPDGIKVDEDGRVYVAGSGGVWVFDRDGRHLGTIVLPFAPANLAWGGSGRNVLYITAVSTLFKIEMTVRGSDSSLPL